MTDVRGEVAPDRSRRDEIRWGPGGNPLNETRGSQRVMASGAQVDRKTVHENNLQLRVLAVVLAALVAFPTAALAQSTIGVLGIAREIAPIERRLQDSREVVVRGYVFRTGTLNGRQVVVGRSGAGKVNASIVATLLITHFNPTAVLFSGTAGAVDPDLRPGDVVIGGTVVQHDVGSQTPNGLTRRGLRNAVTGELDPLMVPASDTLVALARQSAQGLTLPPVRTPDGDRVPDRKSVV